MLSHVWMVFVAIYIGTDPFDREVDMYRYAMKSMREGKYFLKMPSALSPTSGWILVRVDVDASVRLSAEDICFHQAYSILMAIVYPRHRPVRAAMINGHPTFDMDGSKMREGNWVSWGTDLKAGNTGAGINTLVKWPPIIAPKTARANREVAILHCIHLNEESIIVEPSH